MRHLQLFVVLGLALVGCATGTDAGVEGSGTGGEAGAISNGGGNATGGTSTGGSSTGGAQSGGSGGTVTGGQAGDTATGGTTSGGTGGTGGATTGGTGGTGGTTGGTGGTTTGGTGGTAGTGGTTSVSGLSVRYDVGSIDPGTTIDSTIWIFNTGTSTVSLDGLTLYYYLTLTGEVNNPKPRIDWANILPLSGGSADQVGGDLAITKQLLAPAVATADSYFAVTFSGGKQLQPNSRLQFHWTADNTQSQPFVQTNDYSFNASYTADAGTEWDHIVLKQASTVLWGVVP